MSETIRDLVAAELSQPVDARVNAMAEAIASRHSPSSQAVLFYGSCLREKQLEGRMLDFYVIVADYRTAYEKQWLQTANRLIPPNVFYFEADGLTAKYAVLSEADFARQTDRLADSVSVWARFAQPSRLVWSPNEAARAATINTVQAAAPTFLNAATAIAAESFREMPVLDLWRLGFRLTYQAELRAERQDRAGLIVDADPARYERFGRAALSSMPLRPTVRQNVVSFADLDWRDLTWERQLWAKRRRNGKLLSLLRLIKASFTFAGGAEYIAWKINRHAGTQIELKPWQRRHPLLAGISLLPRLLRSGAIR